MITVCCWLWGDKYPEGHVRRLKSAVARNLTVEHRFVCISDRRISGVETIPMPKRPPGATAESIRLWLFSSMARRHLGNDILNLDIDIVITSNIDALVEDPASFKIWQSDSTGIWGYAFNPTVMLVRGGAMDEVWQKFAADAAASLKDARAAGWTGTEQAVIARHFQLTKKPPPVWTAADGIVSMRVIIEELGLSGLHQFAEHMSRIISFHGKREPGQFLHVPWVKENWR